jgi:hypothetical protein
LESDKAQRSAPFGKAGCMFLLAFLLVIIAICTLSQVLPLYPAIRIFLANENDPADVALTFAYSLPFNEMAEMKSYLVQENWEFVEKWPEIHEAVSKECHIPWDPDFEYFMFGGQDNGGSSSARLFYNYDCPGYWYTFYVYELELKRVDGKWQIVRWKEICEDTGSRRRCLDSHSFVCRYE